MTDQLSLYNGALEVLGARKLASLTENREPRHKLDDIWARDAVDRVLQQGQWNFAMRSIQPAISSTVTPAFGYTNAFEIPSDFVRLAGLCVDEFFKNPLTEYNIEAGFIFSDLDVIYLRYVSNDSEYGGDFSLWPPNFTEYVECWMALKVAPRLTGIEFDEPKLVEKLRKRKVSAKATDAMEQPPEFQQPNSWVRARWGATGGDRGSRTNLIG